ncbi:GerMN domain-containing protein [Spirochaeta isovalerica]|uniref:Spore germination protein GerM n=1 Tax=Spirochaeta isovalerica TaxID=150 RepID=A0A841RDU9_9SPIO|nr:GerMN domain-containing protein [Spirochaeta isovalerica]MBB6482235.1 spore germination protein GerM [Spirochaeta isovalerica]
MNRTEQEKNRQKKPAPSKKNSGKKRAPQKKGIIRKKSSEEKSNKSLIPLLIILIILLIATLYLTFGESSSFLSSLISKDTEAPPTIERPEIIQTELPSTEEKDDDTFAVTKEVPLTEEESLPEPEATATPAKEMKSRLFFVKVNDEGQISIKSIIRSIPYDTAPLTETMRSLMLGPDRSDLNKGLLNLIPQNSELLSVKISGGTAFLDFNENFRYNSLGFEGYKAQLMQIVYTATEFDSVSNVQILIQGEKLDYLGAEGVYIGAPIDRDYFNTF